VRCNYVSNGLKYKRHPLLRRITIPSATSTVALAVHTNPQWLETTH